MDDLDICDFPYRRYVAIRDVLEGWHHQNFPDWALRIHRDPDGSGYRIQDGASGVGVRIGERAFHQLMHGMLALRDATLGWARVDDLSWAMMQAAQAWIRQRALPNDAMIFCPDPQRYALIAPGLREFFEREHPALLPGEHGSGEVFAFDPYRGNGLMLVTADTLWSAWAAWNWTLFETTLRRDLESGADVMALKRVVPQWNPTDLLLFACKQVESSLSYYRDSHPDDGDLRAAIEVVRQFARGDATVADVRAAHKHAMAVVKAMGPPQPPSSLNAPACVWKALRASDAAQAVVALTVLDKPTDPPGTLARRAVDVAFNAGCRNPAGWIAAKVHGRAREADLLGYLDVGSSHERDAVRNGRLLDGSPRGARMVLDLQALTVIDAGRDEEE